MLPDYPGAEWAPGCIYYVLSGETGRIKIGFTNKDPSKRLRALQTGSPTRLGLIAIHPGTPELERRLHDQFKADRVHGEWFEFSDDLIVHIADVCKMTVVLHRAKDEEPPQWAVIGLDRIVKMWEAELAEHDAQEGATVQ